MAAGTLWAGGALRRPQCGRGQLTIRAASAGYWSGCLSVASARPPDRSLRCRHNRHRRWSADGTWERILAALQTGSDVPDGRSGGQVWTVAVDSTIVRAHQHAAGARHAPPVDVPADRLEPTALSPSSRAATHSAMSTGGGVE